MKTVTDFIFLGSKVTVDNGYNHKIKRQFAPWKISYAKPRQHVKKQRHHFAGKGPYSQSSGFTVVIDECESWTIKQAELQRIDSFELWCWRSPLRVPWAARSQTSQSYRKLTLNIHWKDWCWSWSSNTLATRCKQPTQWKRTWCWERLKAKGEEGGRGWDG